MQAQKDIFTGLDLNQLAKKQYGNAATIKQTGDHLYNWKAYLNGVEKPLNFGPTFRSIYGNQYLCFATGLHAYDWKMLDCKKIAAGNYVVPVLYIPTDLFKDIEGAKKILADVSSMMGNLQDFYYDKSGRWFKWIPPLVYIAGATDSAALNKISLTGGDGLILHIEKELKNSWDMKQLYDLTQGSSKSISMIAFTKAKVSSPTGIGGRGRGNFCVIPPEALENVVTNYQSMTAKQDAAFFVLAHEGGHALGLPHTCDKPLTPNVTTCLADPKNAKSIMRGDIQSWVKRDGAALGPFDIEKIKAQKVFRYTSLT